MVVLTQLHKYEGTPITQVIIIINKFNGFYKKITICFYNLTFLCVFRKVGVIFNIFTLFLF